MRDLPGDISDAERVSIVQRLIFEGLLAKCDAEVKSSNALLPSEELNGWLPIRINVQPIGTRIEWLYFDHKPLLEPMYAQTVSRLKALVPPPPTKITGVRVLANFKNEVTPSGFIFHISRCGSTLVANALKAVRGTVVVSEPQPIGAILTSCESRSNESSPEELEISEEDLLRGIIRAFGQRRYGSETGLVIKLSSWQILSIQTVRRLWPKVPCLIVIRDPLEVMVSCLRKPPGWMRFKRSSLSADRIFGLSKVGAVNMTDERYCASGIGHFLAAAAAQLGPMCRILDYRNLNTSRIAQISEFFGLDVAQLDHANVESCFKTYSKDSRNERAFIDDRELKQSAATEVMRTEITRWATDSYNMLRENERW